MRAIEKRWKRGTRCRHLRPREFAAKIGIDRIAALHHQVRAQASPTIRGDMRLRSAPQSFYNVLFPHKLNSIAWNSTSVVMLSSIMKSAVLASDLSTLASGPRGSSSVGP